MDTNVMSLIYYSECSSIALQKRKKNLKYFIVSNRDIFVKIQFLVSNDKKHLYCRKYVDEMLYYCHAKKIIVSNRKF